MFSLSPNTDCEWFGGTYSPIGFQASWKVIVFDISLCRRVLRCSLFLDIHFMYMLVRDGTFFIFPLKLMIFGILLHRLRRRATYHHDPHLTLTFNIIVELFSFKFQVSLSGHVLQRFVRPFIEIVNHYCKR